MSRPPRKRSRAARADRPPALPTSGEQRFGPRLRNMLAPPRVGGERLEDRVIVLRGPRAPVLALAWPPRCEGFEAVPAGCAGRHWTALYRKAARRRAHALPPVDHPRVRAARIRSGGKADHFPESGDEGGRVGRAPAP